MPIYFQTITANEPFAFHSVGNHWEQEPVSRPSGCLKYHYLQTEAGCGQIKIEGVPYILHENEGALIAPGVAHSYEKISEKWTTAFVTVTGRMENSIADILSSRKVIFTSREQGEKISPMLQEIIHKIRRFPGATRSLSVDCYRFLMEFVEGASTEDLLDNPLYTKYVSPVIREIESNYASRLTVRSLSQMVFVTPQYLSRLFVRFLGCSTYEYLTNYRISKARELLQCSGKINVQYIAEQVGFEGTSHFIDVFKKQMQVTPYQFRKQSFKK